MSRIDIGEWPHEPHDTVATIALSHMTGDESKAEGKADRTSWIELVVGVAGFIAVVIGAALFSPGSLAL